MAYDMKNSELLEKLIDYAKKIGDENTSLTAERLLVAICDFVGHICGACVCRRFVFGLSWQG